MLCSHLYSDIHSCAICTSIRHPKAATPKEMFHEGVCKTILAKKVPYLMNLAHGIDKVR